MKKLIIIIALFVCSCSSHQGITHANKNMKESVKNGKQSMKGLDKASKVVNARN